MIFAPFSFLNRGAAAVPFPSDITDLTFWLDFSDTSKMSLSGSLVTAVTSSLVSASVDISQYLVAQAPSPANPGATQYASITASLSNPSLNCIKVTSQPVQYKNINWSDANSNIVVQGPKSDTTSYPDGMTFMVLNKDAVDNLGYFMARYTGTTDKGVMFAENRTGGGFPPKTPYETTGVYDFGVSSPTVQYFGDNNNRNVILTRENNGAARTIWLGSTQAATNSGGNDTQTRTTRQFYSVGRYGENNTVESIPIGTHYCELIQYNRVLTSDERTRVWNYLSSKWNITL